MVYEIILLCLLIPSMMGLGLVFGFWGALEGFATDKLDALFTFRVWEPVYDKLPDFVKRALGHKVVAGSAGMARSFVTGRFVGRVLDVLRVVATTKAAWFVRLPISLILIGWVSSLLVVAIFVPAWHWITNLVIVVGGTASVYLVAHKLIRSAIDRTEALVADGVAAGVAAVKRSKDARTPAGESGSQEV